MRLTQVNEAIGADDAASWLQTAGETFRQMLPYKPGGPTERRTKSMEAVLRFLQGRRSEGLGILREAAFAFEDPGSVLDLPIYLLQADAFFDLVRNTPEFQSLLDDYDAYLEPMRERVLEATTSGDWEALRQRTVQGARDDAD